VARAAARLRRLVGNLAATARLERGDAEADTKPVRVRELLATCMESFPGRLARFWVTGGEAVEVWADPDLASQAIVAVLENALDHSPSDEVVEVDVTTSPGEVHIAVADRGPGVAPDMAERVFDAFTQVERGTARTHEGLGIGLYLTGKIMAAHGGRIEHAPREGGGTVFTLTFPGLAGAG
jgi:signal transduction histidine kinase